MPLPFLLWSILLRLHTLEYPLPNIFFLAFYFIVSLINCTSFLLITYLHHLNRISHSFSAMSIHSPSSDIFISQYFLPELLYLLNTCPNISVLLASPFLQYLLPHIARFLHPIVFLILSPNIFVLLPSLSLLPPSLSLPPPPVSAPPPPHIFQSLHCTISLCPTLLHFSTSLLQSR